MGNQFSSEKIAEIKSKLESMYSIVLSKEHISKTIQKDYCNDLKVFVSNEILSKYTKDILKSVNDEIFCGIDETNTNLNNKKALCDRLSEYYLKKVNLVGSIINTLRIGHYKIEQIKQGGLCYGSNNLKTSKEKFKIDIHPTIPYLIKKHDLILLSDDILNIRKETISKLKSFKGELDNENELLVSLALIEIKNEKTCKANGGQWLKTPDELKNVYLIPDESLKSNNQKWYDALNNLENAVYKQFDDLLVILDKLIIEEDETKLQIINGVNGNSVKRIFRDNFIYDTELDDYIDSAKKIIINIFVDLDSYYLILFSIDIVGEKHINDVKNLKNKVEVLEKKIKELKNRGA